MLGNNLSLCRCYLESKGTRTWGPARRVPARPGWCRLPPALPDVALLALTLTCTKAMHREHTQAPHANAVAITSITRRGTIPAQQLLITATRLHNCEAPCSNASVRNTLACKRSCLVHETSYPCVGSIRVQEKADPACYQYYCPTRYYSGTAANNPITRRRKGKGP